MCVGGVFGGGCGCDVGFIGVWRLNVHTEAVNYNKAIQRPFVSLNNYNEIMVNKHFDSISTALKKCPNLL